MMRDKIKMRETLYELGKSVGLEESEIDQAKRTAKTIVSVCIIAGIFGLLGFFSSRLDAVGLWYTGISIRDFGMLGNFF